jgi:hypothetical protein
MGLGHFPADPETENASPYQADGTYSQLQQMKIFRVLHFQLTSAFPPPACPQNAKKELGFLDFRSDDETHDDITFHISTCVTKWIPNLLNRFAHVLIDRLDGMVDGGTPSLTPALRIKRLCSALFTPSILSLPKIRMPGMKPYSLLLVE